MGLLVHSDLMKFLKVALIILIAALPGCAAPDEAVQQTRIVHGRLGAYHFQTADSPPLATVLIAPGFLRGARDMAGWGWSIALAGHEAYAVDLPSLTNSRVNAEALAGFAQTLKAENSSKTPLVLMGFSKGGLSTLLAMEKVNADAWIGIDPVDQGELGEIAAARVQAPGLLIKAEPSPFNLGGNTNRIEQAYGGKLNVQRLDGASHFDVENPSRSGVLSGSAAAQKQDTLRATVLEFLGIITQK